MKKVWIVSGALLGVALLLLLMVGLVGSDTLRVALPVMVLTAAAVLIPGGAVWGKAVWLLVGTVVAMLGFVLGAGALPDNDVGYFLGAAIPLLIVSVAVMWTKRVQYLMAAVCGVAAFQAVYSTFFFSDPQSINFSMPIAFGLMLVPMALTFLVMSLLTTLLPDLLDDPHPAKPTGPPNDAPAASTDDAGASDSTGSEVEASEVEDEVDETTTAKPVDEAADTKVGA